MVPGFYRPVTTTQGHLREGERGGGAFLECSTVKYCCREGGGCSNAQRLREDEGEWRSGGGGGGESEGKRVGRQCKLCN